MRSRRKAVAVALVAVLAATAPAWAQDARALARTSITLAEALTQALARNRDLAVSRRNIDISQGRALPLRAGKDKTQPVGEQKAAPRAKGHDEAGPIKLSPEQRQALGIKVESIQPRILEAQVDVFVEEGDGFVPRPVETGQDVGGWIPVLKGLTAGDKVVTGGGFDLKAQILKAKLGED